MGFHSGGAGAGGQPGIAPFFQMVFDNPGRWKPDMPPPPPNDESAATAKAPTGGQAPRETNAMTATAPNVDTAAASAAAAAAGQGVTGNKTLLGS